MMIRSDRPTQRDAKEWQIRTRYLLRPPQYKIEAALNAVREFLASGEAAVSVSWGKDSVVVAHLAESVDPNIRIEWAALRGLEAPETYAVRDAFLTAHQDVDYWEHHVELPIMRGQRGFPGSDIDILGDTMPSRVITGVRAAESKQRALSAAVHGITTAHTCRPILRWTTIDVLGYLLSEDLPIHPAYTMSLGGVLSLDDIRVHSLGTAVLHGSSFWPRITQWEDTYYRDVIDAELARRARH